MRDEEAAATAADDDGAAAAAIRFSAAVLLLSLFLQRVAVPVGEFMLFVVGPIGLGLAAVGLARGALALNRNRALVFLAVCALVIAGGAVNEALPSYFDVRQSWPAVIQFIGLTSFAVLTFPRPIDEDRFFRAMSNCLAVIAGAGIFQFLVQFAGVDLFLLGDHLPPRYLMEMPGWNTRIPIGSSPYFKSNGLFLLEPSVFSQFMSLALMIEVLYSRRPLFIGLFLAGLIASLSGTGWIVMAAFVVSAVLRMGRRGALLSAGVLLAAAVALGVLAFVFPEAFSSFVERRDEFWIIDTSGHLRFVTPFWIMGEAIGKVPWTLLTGTGAGVPDRITVSYDFSLMTPVKLIAEFGVPVFVLYAALIVVGRRTPRQATLLLPGMILLLLTGAYIQIAPMLFPLWLLVTVPNLAPAAEAQAEPGIRQGSYRPLFAAPRHGSANWTEALPRSPGRPI